jgi:hypothetical protein
MCAEACLSFKFKAIVFAKKYCKCGDSPDDFLAEALLASEYQDRMEVRKGPGAVVDMSRTYLTASDSQPRCCPDVALALDFKWKDGTVDADYYATYDMGGCGRPAMCGKLGREKKAQVVTFSQSTKLCHLGKNMHAGVILGSSIGVTTHRILDD